MGIVGQTGAVEGVFEVLEGERVVEDVGFFCKRNDLKVSGGVWWWRLYSSGKRRGGVREGEKRDGGWRKKVERGGGYRR